VEWKSHYKIDKKYNVVFHRYVKIKNRLKAKHEGDLSL